MVRTALLLSFLMSWGGCSRLAPTPTPQEQEVDRREAQGQPYTPGPTSRIEDQAGNFKSYLNEYYLLGDGSAFSPPSDQELNVFRHIIYSLEAKEDYREAHYAAEGIGMKLVRYENTSAGALSNRTVYILREKGDVSAHKGHGIYVFNPSPSSKRIVIQAPHPKFDAHTRAQAIDIFMKTNARWLMISGTDRRAGSAGNCHADVGQRNLSQSYMKRGDAAHNVRHMFYAGHYALTNHPKDEQHLLFLQMHGFTATQKLRRQCNEGRSNPRGFVVLSEGVNTLRQQDHLTQKIFTALSDGETGATSCFYNKEIIDRRQSRTNSDKGKNYTTVMGATLSPMARLSNHAGADRYGKFQAQIRTPNICKLNQGTTQNTHRFIHIEQSAEVRMNPHRRKQIVDEVSRVINRFFAR